MWEHFKNMLDHISAITALAAFAAILPAIASTLSIAWYLIRIYEWWKGRQNGNIRHD